MNTAYARALFASFLFALCMPMEVFSQTAAFEWSVPKRYSESWTAFNESQAQYDASYAQPANYTIIVNGCRSVAPGETIKNYEWKLKRVGNNVELTKTATGCRTSISDRQLQPGKYTLTLTIETASGRRAQRTQPVEFRDWLIVSLGDSFSSGEGNPDEEGEYSLPQEDHPHDPRKLIQACQGERGTRRKWERWESRRCHRSKRSAPALVAKQLEDDDQHSSVTFLSYACSGATTRHLIDQTYEGIHPLHRMTTPPDEAPLPPMPAPVLKLPPQIESVKNAVGNRTIDALIISIGINDLAFSELLTACGKPSFRDVIELVRDIKVITDLLTTLHIIPENTGCITDTLVKRMLQVNRNYDDLARAIKTHLKVKEVYIIEYPSNVFQHRDGSPSVCECLDVADKGISDEEANWLGATGTALNRTIAYASNRNKFNYVLGVYESFAGKGYCAGASERYFRRIYESLKIQGDRDGGVHPNRRGHEKVNDLVTSAITLDRNPRATKSVTVTYKCVRTARSPDIHDITIPTNIDLWVRLRPRAPFNRFPATKWPVIKRNLQTFRNFAHRQWVPLARDSSTFRFNLYAAPQPLRWPVDFDVVARVDNAELVKPSIMTLMPVSGLPVAQSRTFTVNRGPFSAVEFTVTIRDVSDSEAADLDGEAEATQ